jgi:ABC-type multidrug transport system fused ATPase/permease subunit
VINEGRIVEDGDFNNLMKKENGHFANLALGM